MAKAQVVTNDPPIEKEILAEDIAHLSEATAKLSRNGLNRKAILVLLNHATKIPQKEIKLILDTLPELHRLYCR